GGQPTRSLAIETTASAPASRSPRMIAAVTSLGRFYRPLRDGVRRTETIGIRMLPEYMVADQRFAARRPDVLVYETDVLKQDVTLAGPLVADLHVSTSGTDSDWIVKLIDVYPDRSPDPSPNPSG